MAHGGEAHSAQHTAQSAQPDPAEAMRSELCAVRSQDAESLPMVQCPRCKQPAPTTMYLAAHPLSSAQVSCPCGCCATVSLWTPEVAPGTAELEMSEPMKRAVEEAEREA